MSLADLQSWDTLEVERWVDNDEGLYVTICAADLSADDIREIIAEFRTHVPDLDIDTALVSWHYLAGVYSDPE